MRSQQDRSCRVSARRLAAWLLVVLAWGLGQALALGHRVEPGAAAAHGLHAVGGEHHDGEAQCRLVDQTGLGEALATALLLPLRRVAPEREVARGGCRPPPAEQRHAYEARAPPHG
jgi:hypothetical protein